MLQSVFGIGWEEAWLKRPAWEIDNLLKQYAAEQQRLREG